MKLNIKYFDDPISIKLGNNKVLWNVNNRFTYLFSQVMVEYLYNIVQDTQEWKVEIDIILVD